MCQAGWRVQAFTGGLQTTPDVSGVAVHELENWGQKDNTSTHSHFSCWWLIRAKNNFRSRRYFSCPPSSSLEMVRHRTFYLLEGAPSLFRGAALLGVEKYLQTTHWPPMLASIWILWSSKQASGLSFQPNFPDVWEESSTSARSQFSQQILVSNSYKHVIHSVMNTKKGEKYEVVHQWRTTGCAFRLL